MAMYIYRTDGHPVGFRHGNCIHDLSGEALGRVLGTHVFRFDGSYAGELFKDSVVARPLPVSVRPIQAIPRPPRASSPGPSFRRRGLVDYGFSDAFDRLYEEGSAPAHGHLSIAAE